jgi:hypothetical protein
MPQALPMPPRWSKAGVTLFTLMIANHKQYISLVTQKSHEGDAQTRNRMKAMLKHENA